MKAFDRYKIGTGDDLGNPDTLNDRFRDLDNRLHSVEQSGAVIDAKAGELEAAALSRLDDVFTQHVLMAQERAAAVGANFRAESTTSLTIATGELTITLSASTRGGFVPADYALIRDSADPDRWLHGRVISYVPLDGTLTVDVERALGDGSGASWFVRPAAPFDIEHATRLDNPHGTTAAQVGAYTQAQADAALAAHADRNDNPHGVTKAQIGLGNVNNTSDANKPISTATAAALSLKADLDVSGKVPTSQLPDTVLGALRYQGAWNANTNNPAMSAAAASNKGFYFVVSVAGSTNLNGENDWQVGDWVVSNGATWSKIDNSEVPDSRLPTRLRKVLADPRNDWNLYVETGKFQSFNGSNQPETSGQWVGDVWVYGPRILQIAYRIDQDGGPRYVRSFDGSTWSAWRAFAIEPYPFRVTKSAAQTGVAAGVPTKVTFDVVDYDISGLYLTANSRMYLSKGRWLIRANLHVQALEDGKRVSLQFYKNGAANGLQTYQTAASTLNEDFSILADISTPGGEYFELMMTAEGTTAKTINANGQLTWMAGHRIGGL